MVMLDNRVRSARGAALQARLYGEAPAEPATPWQESVRDFVYAEGWSRPGLDMRARLLIALAGSAMFGFAEAAIEGVAKAALITGELSLRELREAALHIAVYSGWGRGGQVDAAVTRAAAALGLREAECPPLRAGPWDPEQRTKEGMAEFVNVMTFPGGPSVSPYLEGINNFVFGEMWCRTDGLDQRSRRWLTLVGVCESTAEVPMKSHIHAAMASGNCQPAEMQEFVLAYGHCAGWPRASLVQGIVWEQIRNFENGLTWNGQPAAGEPA